MYSQPTEIMISPVANGYVVTLPSQNENSDFQQQMDVAGSVLKKILPGVTDELSEIRQHAEDQRKSEDGVRLVRAQNVHIFHTFSEALAFLKVTINED